MEKMTNRLNLLKQQINNHRKAIANLNDQKENLIQQRERMVKSYAKNDIE